MASKLSESAEAEAYMLFWAKRRRRLFWRGIMPWNWRSNDIWTAYVMADRELASARRALSESSP